MSISKIHFIGIGGVGMSGIAAVAQSQGYAVSGSDLRASRYTEQLEDAGVRVFIGHDEVNLPEGTDDVVVVVSTAILKNNPEYRAAQERGLTIWHRAQMLAFLGVGKQTLACTGTHGKTTTSSMLASVLDVMGLDPSFLIGGIVRSYGTNAHAGKGDYYVVEADESDKSFTYLDPAAVLVTNIEADHLDHYSGIEEIYGKFFEFMSSVPEDGLLVVCGDDAALVDLASTIDRKRYSYGFGEQADCHISNYVADGVSSTFDVTFPDGQTVSSTVKQNPGAHNVLNAAGVLTMVWALGLDVAQAAAAMEDFIGVARRFDTVGEAAGITIVDDYAHHPTEIAATLEAAADLEEYNRVHVLFQPHRYSRAKLFTDVLRNEFGRAFDAADSVTFMDVYPAGEAPVPGISGQTFLDVVLEHEGHPADTCYVPRRLELAANLASRLEPGDLLITMGAGNVTSVGPELLAFLREQVEAGLR